MPQTTQNSGTRWKLGITLLIAVFLVGMTASLIIAARRVSRVVDPDYYNHGLHYGKNQDGSQNAGTGWTIAAALSGNQLQVRVTDQSGAPVAGGKLKFEQRVKGGTQPDQALQLSESAPGVFRAERPGPASGELLGTLHFTRGEAAASRKLVLIN
jgi:nitrogen fixation protein FixH